ncbi:hypothetical protein Ccrd_020289 [Cynara cardunculus var. scolymus]|uniref:Uncharacterized protein n=1 Tax=Cynara cardunculus var. scolymus TaxID=59895 RepID=A0A118K0Y9_CYNCS|nr:hypothetical protein Ccrd_020289 [Cynara cardunculus var. scolymus]
MAHVDHAFSISNEDTMTDSDSSYSQHNRPPVKEIGLAIALLIFGIVGVVSASSCPSIAGYAVNTGVLSYVDCLLRIQGYKGFSFSNIPPVYGFSIVESLRCSSVRSLGRQDLSNSFLGDRRARELLGTNVPSNLLVLPVPFEAPNLQIVSISTITSSIDMNDTYTIERFTLDNSN